MTLLPPFCFHVSHCALKKCSFPIRSKVLIYKSTKGEGQGDPSRSSSGGYSMAKCSSTMEVGGWKLSHLERSWWQRPQVLWGSLVFLIKSPMQSQVSSNKSHPSPSPAFPKDKCPIHSLFTLKEAQCMIPVNKAVESEAVTPPEANQ